MAVRLWCFEINVCDLNRSPPQHRAAELAVKMQEGSVPYLKGVIELVELRDELGIYANDSDFVVFTAILMEIDQLPLGRNLDNWTDVAMKRYADEIKASTEWAKSISLAQCQSIATRFGR